MDQAQIVATINEAEGEPQLDWLRLVLMDLLNKAAQGPKPSAVKPKPKPNGLLPATPDGLGLQLSISNNKKSSSSMDTSADPKPAAPAVKDTTARRPTQPAAAVQDEDWGQMVLGGGGGGDIPVWQ
jgi:hypothetical protein